MDINYHYFAIKAIAVYAGFDEEKAQKLASFSQFVDDFDTYRYLILKEIPDYASHLAIRIGNLGWLFNPVTTGFNSFFDYLRLAVPANQRKILIPFHFITEKPLTVTPKSRLDYRVKPVKMEEASLLQGMLVEASELYQAAQNDENLIRIGILLHIFADTYAHQRFSGFWDWENHAYLKNVVDNSNGKNITQSYSPDNYYYVPSIGHPNVNTAPDDSNITFKILQKKLKDESYPYQDIYERDNTEVFLVASREILNYLRECQELENIDDESWDSLECKLRKGLQTSEKNYEKLVTHWSGIFTEIPFKYNKDDLYITNFVVLDENKFPAANQIVIGETDELKSYQDWDYSIEMNLEYDKVYDDFFYFNVIADSIRKKVDPAFEPDSGFIKYSNDLNSK
jgi:hypothetical protein